MLSDKQKKFCEEYRIDLNATQAAIRCGYSKKTAYSQGQRLLKNVEIQKYLSSIQKEDSIRNNVTVDWIMDELKKTHQAAFRIGKYSPAVRALDLMAKMTGSYKDPIPDISFNYIGRHNIDEIIAEEEEQLRLQKIEEKY